MMTEERYCVRELLLSDDTSRLEHLLICYPSERAAVQVSSELAVWLTKDQHYHVCLRQDDLRHKTHKAYVLYVSQKLDGAKKGFEGLRDLLDPLLVDCTLLLTEEVLSPLVTPTPIDHSQFPLFIAHMKASNSAAFSPLWERITEVLITDAVCRGDEQAAKKLAESLSSGHDVAVTVGRFERSPRHDSPSAINIAARAISQELERGFATFTAAVSTKIATVDSSNAVLGLLANLTKDSSVSPSSHKRSVESNVFTKKNDTLSPVPAFSSILNRILNKPSEDGTTSLMRSIQTNNFKNTFALLRAGADLNTRNEQNGYTALHYAVELNGSSITFVKLLLSYRASMDIKNRDGQTALQLSNALNSPAKGIIAEIRDLTDNAIEYSKGYSQKAETPDLVAPSNDGHCLLCLDGGGSRAVIACQILKAIEEKMKQLSPTCGPLISYFDHVAGTSAGGIIALSLVHAKVSIDSSLALSLKVIDKSFKTKPPSPTINTTAIESCLKEHFTDEQMMDAVTQPRVMIMTTLVDRHPPDLHIFRNYGNETSDGSPCKTKVWEAARATSAAPRFFHSFHGKWADGGLTVNNPTLAALTELLENVEEGKPLPKVKMVVSVGTGAAEAVPIQHSSIYTPGGSFWQTMESLVNVNNSVKGFKQLWDLLVAQTTRSDGDVSIAKAWCRSIGASYFRLSPRMLNPVLFDHYDTVDEAVLTDMMYEGLMYALKEHKTVDQVARCMLSRHIA